MKDNTPKIKSVFIGCDPEFFLLKKKAITTAFHVGIPGSKKEPFSIGEGVFIHPDNVTLEVGMPAMEYSLGSTVGDYVTYFNSKMGIVRGHLSEKYGNEVEIYDMAAESSFPLDLLKPEQNRVFGCDPDLNAYKGGEENTPVNPDKVKTYRFCGGHIHIGYDKASVSIPEYALVILAECMASPIFIANGVGSIRRYYYGTPGAFRKKPYGFEYRTPNNLWARVASDEKRAPNPFIKYLPEVIASVVLWAINNEKEAQKLWDTLDPPNMVEYFQALNTDTTKVWAAYTDIVEPWLREYTNLDLRTSYALPARKQEKRIIPPNRIEEALARLVDGPNLDQAQWMRADDVEPAQDQARAIRERNVNQIAGLPEWVQVNRNQLAEIHWDEPQQDR